MRAPPGRRAAQEPLARRRWIILHDHRAALDHGKGFTQTFDSRSERGSRTEVEDDYVIFGVVDDLFKRELQLDPAPSAQAALEDRQLHPLAVSVHDPKNAAPTALALMS